MTLKQVAAHLQLSERTLYRLLHCGELPGRKVGGQWRFRMCEVDYWLDLRVARMRSADLRHLEGAGATRTALLSQALQPENALIRVPAGTPRDVVRTFVNAVTYLLLLLLAPDDRTQLMLLARAARLCRDSRLLRGLRAARTSRDVVRLVRASERTVFRPNSETE